MHEATPRVPRGISRNERDWRVDIQRVGHERVRRRFTDSVYGSPAASLAAAEQFLETHMPRRAYTGIDLTRNAVRAITVERRARKVSGGWRDYYSLTTRPSQSHLLRGWMSISLGREGAFDQTDIDQTLALLSVRWVVYRVLCRMSNHAQAVDGFSYRDLPPATDHPHELLLADVLGWTGAGAHVRFAPAPVGAAIKT